MNSQNLHHTTKGHKIPDSEPMNCFEARNHVTYFTRLDNRELNDWIDRKAESGSCLTKDRTVYRDCDPVECISNGNLKDPYTVLDTDTAFPNFWQG